MLALPADTARPEHRPKHLRLPCLAGDSGNVAPVEVGAERAERVAADETLCEFANHRGFVLADRLAIGVISVWTCAAAANASGLRELERLSADASALVVAL